MKPEELMIGDILKYMETIVKVYSIGVRIVVEECFGKNTYIVDLDNLLKGLKLTPEILEKNGFTGGEYVNYIGNVWYLKQEEFVDLVLTVSHNTAILWGKKKLGYPYSSGNNFLISNIHSVHELQHALRLCGINKEIEVQK